MAKGSDRVFLRAEALDIFDEVHGALTADGMVVKATACGSIRRGKMMVNDLDVVVVSCYDNATPIWETIATNLWEPIERLTCGPVEFKFKYKGLQIDLRNFLPEQEGAGLLFSTGNAMFNISMRSRAKVVGDKRGETFKLNRYGVQLIKGGIDENVTFGFSESGIFGFLGMPFVEPADRSLAEYEMHRADSHSIPIENSKGTGVYNVVLSGGKLSCPCKGFTFRGKCRHVTEARAMVDNIPEG